MTTPDEPDTEDGGPEDEVDRLQRELDVANDLGPVDPPAEQDPPGDPAR